MVFSKIVSNENKFFVIIMIFFIISSLFVTINASFIKKRNFVEVGCLGSFDSAKFARLDRLCEECYTVIRTPGLDGKLE